MTTELREKMKREAIKRTEQYKIPSNNCSISDFLAGAQSMYDELKPVVDWVSVEEKLPKHAQKVLMKTQSGYVEGGYFEYKTFRKNDDALVYGVTHWRKIEL